MRLAPRKQPARETDSDRVRRGRKPRPRSQQGAHLDLAHLGDESAPHIPASVLWAALERAIAYDASDTATVAFVNLCARLGI